VSSQIGFIKRFLNFINECRLTEQRIELISFGSSIGSYSVHYLYTFRSRNTLLQIAIRTQSLDTRV
jgi:hypothetical protein